MDTMLTQLRDLREVASNVLLSRIDGGGYRIEFTRNAVTTAIDGEQAAALIGIAHSIACEDLS